MKIKLKNLNDYKHDKQGDANTSKDCDPPTVDVFIFIVFILLS